MEYVSDFDLNLNFARYRTYDPAVGRFLQIDPKAEKFYSQTPYNGMLNNPIKYSDPQGDCPICKVLWKSAKNLVKKGKLDVAGQVAEIGADGYQVVSPSSTFGQRVEGLFNLASPMSTRDIKAFKKWLKNDQILSKSEMSKIKGGMKFDKVSTSDAKKFISTEPGAQSADAIKDIKKKMEAGDDSVFSEPIFTTTIDGKTYTLDGHHRIQAAIETDKVESINVVNLSQDEAMQLFKDKTQDIIKGSFE